MTALATSADVEAQLGRSLTSEESARIGALLDRASAQARRVTGRAFTAGDYTVTRTVRDGKVSLGETVDEVTAVRAINQYDGTTETLDTDSWTVRGNVVYGLSYWCEVEVDFTVTADVPADLVAEVAALAGAWLETPTTNVESETTGPFTVRYKDGSSATASSTELFRTFAAPRLGVISIFP